MTRVEISTLMGIHDEKHFREMYQQVAIKLGYIEMTIPDKPKKSFSKIPINKQRDCFSKQFDAIKPKHRYGILLKTIYLGLHFVLIGPKI